MKSFYCFDGEEITLHDTEQQAFDAANAALADYRSDCEDGWNERVELVQWGVLAPIGASVQLNRTERCNLGYDGGPCDDDEMCDRPHDFDYTCDYRPAPLPSITQTDLAHRGRPA